jgi:hypothetical protein
MHDDQTPPCIIRTSPNDFSTSLDITYLAVAETEYLLDNQEELISTPLKIKYNSTVHLIDFFLFFLIFFPSQESNHHPLIILAIPYIIKRSPYRENVIKIHQSNGLWISVETNESTFDSYKVNKKSLLIILIQNFSL